jgi:hypothetical protein
MSFYADLYDANGALKHLLNGVWRTSASGELSQVSNPSKGGVAYRVQGVLRVDSWQRLRIQAELLC